MASKHQHDLIMCRKLAGRNIGRLCEKCEGRCVICDSWVHQKRPVKICDDCNFGSLGSRCIICSMPGVAEAFYCRECTKLEKDRDGCPRIINLGQAKVDRFYQKKESSKPDVSQLFKWSSFVSWGRINYALLIVFYIPQIDRQVSQYKLYYIIV